MIHKIGPYIGLVAILVAMAAMGFTVVSRQQTFATYKRITDSAQKTSHAACLRTQRLAPPLLAFYHGFKGTSHAIDPKILRVYDATVPKKCP